MKYRYLLILLISIGIAPFNQLHAQKKVVDVIIKHNPPKKFYASGEFAALFQTATIESPFSNQSLGTLRFTYGMNYTLHLNYDIQNWIGLYTGVGIKNIGFIEKAPIKDSTIKRRLYSLTVPLGIKLGNVKKRSYAIIGGGIDLPLNYREKSFENRGDKIKYSEWFSDRVPQVMPYIFAGASLDPGITIKAYYYPQNFFNADYTQQLAFGVARPYANYNVNLLVFTFGFDINYNKKGKVVYEEVLEKE